MGHQNQRSTVGLRKNRGWLRTPEKAAWSRQSDGFRARKPVMHTWRFPMEWGVYSRPKTPAPLERNTEHDHVVCPGSKSYSFSPRHKPLRGVTSSPPARVSSCRRCAYVRPDSAKLEPRLASSARASPGNPTAFRWNQTVPPWKTGHKVQLVKDPEPHQQTSQEAQLPPAFQSEEHRAQRPHARCPWPGAVLPLARVPVPLPLCPAPPHSHTTTATNTLRLPQPRVLL